MNATAEIADTDARARRRGLIAAIGCISAVGAAIGLSTPLLAIVLEKAGASNSFIGFNTAMSAVPALMATPLMPIVLRHAPLRPFLLGCLALAAISMLGVYVAGDRLWIWWPLRFLIGVAISGLFVGSEIWINAIARDENRGAVLGLYATMLAAGFALGPLVLQVTGVEGFPPFAGALVIFALAAGPLLSAASPPLETIGGESGFFRLIAGAPATFTAASAFAAAETAVLNLMPIYILLAGLGERSAVLVVTVYGAGTIALQVLIGKAADLSNRRTVLAACAGVGILGALLFPAAARSGITLFPLLFIWGGVIVGLYTVGLSLLGARFKGPLLARANSGFVFMYAFGALIGAPLAGVAMDLSTRHGLPVAVASIMGAYLALLAWRWRSETP